MNPRGRAEPVADRLSAQGSLRPQATDVFALTTITVLSIFYQQQSRHMLYLQRSQENFQYDKNFFRGPFITYFIKHGLPA